MSQQTKIFFILISIVLTMVTALQSGSNTSTPTPDIELGKCTQTNMEVTLNKNGDYYIIPQSSSGKQTLLKTVKNTPVQVTIPLTGKVIKVLRIDGDVVTKNSVIYEVSCVVARNVILTRDLNVDISKVVKKQPVKPNATAKIVFEKNSQEVKSAVQIGDRITLKAQSMNPIIKFIEVKRCNASNKAITKTIFPWASNPINIVKKSDAEIEFDAFRLSIDSDPVITFNCDVLLCSDPKGCKVTTYEMEQNNQKNDQVKGVLVVYLSEKGMLSSSSKLRSYSIGLLATMGAVLLQHQFI